MARIVIENILILCIGDICRSPVAEGLLKKKSAAIDFPVQVVSAGLHAMVGAPADATAQSLMQAVAGDISAHRARQVNQAMILEADLIVTMDRAQQRQIESKFPTACGKVHRLGKWGDFEVLDPYKRPLIVFKQVFSLIEEGIEDWCRVLRNKR